MTTAVPPEESGDRELVQRLKRRDERAVEVLYDRYGRLVFSLAQRILGEPSDAEDVVIEVFAQVWRDAERFDATRGSLATWLTMITRSRALDAARARGNRLRIVGAATDASHGSHESAPAMGRSSADASAMVVDAERRDVVRTALDALSDVQREAIELAYFGGLSQSEIAERLHQPLGTIKTRVRLGMLRLREALFSYYERTDG